MCGAPTRGRRSAPQVPDPPPHRGLEEGRSFMRSTRTSRRRGVSLAAVAAGLAAVAACSPPSSSSSSTSNSGSGGASAATATSAQDLGGLSALETAANKEGALNVIALPPDWANYGAILKAFKAKYPQIKVTSAQPDASSK